MDKIYYIIVSAIVTGAISFSIWMVQRAFRNIQKTIERQNDNFVDEFKQLNANIVKTNESILKYKLTASEIFAKDEPNTTAHKEIWLEIGKMKERLTRNERTS